MLRQFSSDYMLEDQNEDRGEKPETGAQHGEAIFNPTSRAPVVAVLGGNLPEPHHAEMFVTEDLRSCSRTVPFVSTPDSRCGAQAPCLTIRRFRLCPAARP